MFISFQKNERNQSLWHRFIAGDKTAFGELYTHYHKSLTAFCIGRMESVELAENIASETLIKLLQYPKPEEIDNFESWIFTVAKNVCSTHLSTVKRRKHLLVENYKVENDHAPEIEQKFSMENIDQLIRSSLDETDYKIWQLHQQGYDNFEIAEMINSSEKTVANRKSAARMKLKAIFKQFNNE
jgi:RNA polymerase sigma factor (sigma-70 family)